MVQFHIFAEGRAYGQNGVPAVVWIRRLCRVDRREREKQHQTALHARVLASDIDPLAVSTARANARSNAVSHRVEVLRAAGVRARRFALLAPFDLVSANILLKPLQRLARPLSRLLAPNARVILSGLLPSQANRSTAGSPWCSCVGCRGKLSKADFAVGAEPHQFEMIGVRLPVDQDQVGPDVAVPAIIPFAAERMIAVTGWQNGVGCEQPHHRHQVIVEFLVILPGFSGSLALVIALELIGVLNRPHSGCLADSLPSPRLQARPAAPP